jgi:hypothetical protein
MRPGECGAREYLFLWSECVLHVWPWPERLQDARYFPGSDRVEITQPNGRWSFKVTREGSESCDILRRCGLTYEDIDKALKEWVGGGPT